MPHYAPITHKEEDAFFTRAQSPHPTTDVSATLARVARTNGMVRCVIVFFAYTSGILGALYIKEVLDRLFVYAHETSMGVKMRTLAVALVVIGVAIAIFCGTRVTMHGQNVDKIWQDGDKRARD